VGKGTGLPEEWQKAQLGPCRPTWKIAQLLEQGGGWLLAGCWLPDVCSPPDLDLAGHPLNVKQSASFMVYLFSPCQKQAQTNEWSRNTHHAFLFPVNSYYIVN